MMKKITTLSSGIFVLIFILTSSLSQSQNKEVTGGGKNNTHAVYKDGLYTGMSRGEYIFEPFWGISRIKIENGLFSEVKFIIRDSSLHEIFNGDYEKHFADNPEYILQSRNDWAGVQAYPKKLSEVQDTNKLDAISGATWSFNIFKASVSDALKNGGPETEKITTYIKKTYMIPMRDGIKLFTVVLTPKECSRKLPVLMQRTPYSAEYSDMEDSTLNVDQLWFDAING